MKLAFAPAARVELFEVASWYATHVDAEWMVFVARAESLRIVAISHERRAPMYWADRL